MTYVLFYNASHMVPYDYPRRSRDMLDRFLNVDIASIGGSPADSQIDGEKVPQTSVGGHPNSTAAEQTEKEKPKQNGKRTLDPVRPHLSSLSLREVFGSLCLA